MALDQVAQSIIDELPELYEQIRIADIEIIGSYDYILGCIETRLTILGRMGVPDNLIPQDPNDY